MTNKTYSIKPPKDKSKIKITNASIEIIHIAGCCIFCGQCTDWPNDYCVSCKEEGFDEEDKKQKELEKDRLHA